MSYVASLQASIRQFLDVNDEIREVLGESVDINTSSIVVVGDQSSGKSSVLERLSGVELPRGQDIVTRVPLELRMKKSDKTKIHIWAEGLEKKQLLDLSTIYKEIDTLTRGIAGDNANIVNKPIYLSIEKPDVPDLTLIDLPGITRNPIRGQAANIHSIVVSLIKQYITPVEAVIMCVLSATEDFTNSEALQLAKEVDPERKRTCAAITKIDKADSGVQPKLDILTELNLTLGWVAVRNRTSEELSKNITTEKARINEATFFQQHPEWKLIPPNYRGVDELGKLLTNIQIARIRATLPNTIKSIRVKLNLHINELDQIKSVLFDTPEGSFAESMRLVDNAAEIVRRLLRAEYEFLPPERNSKPVRLAPRMFELYEKFANNIRKTMSMYLNKNFEKRIEECVKEKRGYGLSNFVPFSIIEDLVREEIGKFDEPCMLLLDDIRAYLESQVQGEVSFHFRKFPILKEEISQKILDELKKKSDSVIERTQVTLKMQLDIFTMNSFYMETVSKVRNLIRQASAQPGSYGATQFSALASTLVPDNTLHAQQLSSFMQSKVQSTSNEDLTILDVQISMFAFMEILVKRVVDEIILTMRFFLSNPLPQLIKDAVISIPQVTVHEMMAPDPNVARKKDLLESQVTRLKAALETTKKLRNYR
jgi:GTPase SAR1 family protein